MQKSLVNAWLIGLGMGMLILAIAGLASKIEQGWLVWLDLAGAALSIALAALMKPLSSNAKVYGGIVALSLGVFALWVLGLITQVTPFLAWWNFAFALAFLMVGLAAISKKEEAATAHEIPPRQAA